MLLGKLWLDCSHFRLSASQFRVRPYYIRLLFAEFPVHLAYAALQFGNPALKFSEILLRIIRPSSRRGDSSDVRLKD